MRRNEMKKITTITLFITILTIAVPSVFAKNGVLPKLGFSAYAEGTKTTPQFTYGLGANIELQFQAFTWGFFKTRFSVAIPTPHMFFHASAAVRTSAALNFDFASLHFPNIRQKNVSTVVFLGAYDFFGSDSILHELLKVDMRLPSFIRYRYGNLFHVNTPIRYVGITAYGLFPDTNFYMSGTVAWNGLINKDGQNAGISFDLRAGGVDNLFAFDISLGSEIVPASLGDSLFRTGMTFTVMPAFQTGLYARFGFFDTSAANFKTQLLNNFYFVLEPRYNSALFSGSIAFFRSPVAATDFVKHLPTPSPAVGAFWGTNLSLTFGNVKDEKHLEGGFGVLAAWNMQNYNFKNAAFYELAITPFFRYKLSSFSLDAALGFRPLNYQVPASMFFAEFSLTAEF